MRGAGTPSIKLRLSINLSMFGDDLISMLGFCKTRMRTESFMFIKRSSRYNKTRKLRNKTISFIVRI